jgi:hypothetical protein
MTGDPKRKFYLPRVKGLDLVQLEIALDQLTFGRQRPEQVVRSCRWPAKKPPCSSAALVNIGQFSALQARETKE